MEEGLQQLPVYECIVESELEDEGAQLRLDVGARVLAGIRIRR